MDKKLLKYWKNCLLDAERRSRSLKKEARVTLRIGDKVPEFILRKDIPLLFPKGIEPFASVYSNSLSDCTFLLYLL